MMDGSYTTDERRAFDAYCIALMDLVDNKAVTDERTYQGLACRGGLKCSSCAGAVPPGIPAEMRNSDRVACPRCVFARDLAKALQRELSACAMDLTSEERTSLLASVLAPKRRP